MSIHLPLAADIGDLIFMLIVLGGGLIQWLASRNKKPQDHDTSPYEDPFPRDYAPTRREGAGETEPSWDELMEALGQKPGDVGPDPVEPSPALPTPAAPPVPANRPLPPPVPVTLQPTEPAPLSDYVRTLLAAIEEKKEASTPSAYEISAPASNTPMASQPRRQNNLPGLLRDRSVLRRAVILQEILQPPLALR